MFCHKCGAKIPVGAKFCESCGAPVLGSAAPPLKQTPLPPRGRTSGHIYDYLKRGAGVLVAIAIVGYWIYSSQDKQAVTTNNDAIAVYNASDTATSTQQVIQQLQSAYTKATDDSTKMTALENLALAYDKNSDNAGALKTFQQALRYASQGSFDYYFISGEIAEYQNEPGAALADYDQAYQLNPQSYKVNNELGLFYLDLNSSWTAYDDNAKALQYLKTTYNIRADSVSAKNLAVAYYYNNNYRQTISLLMPFNISDFPAVAFWIGRAYAGENDSADAKKYFQKGIDAGVQVPQDVTEYMNSH